MHWTPSTLCGCQLEINPIAGEWFDAQGNWLDAGKTVKACEFHQALAGTPQHLEVILKEERGKNVALQSSAESLPETVEFAPKPEASPQSFVDNGATVTFVYAKDDCSKRFIAGKEPGFRFDGTGDKRTLAIKVMVDSGKAAQFKLDYDQKQFPYPVTPLITVESL